MTSNKYISLHISASSWFVLMAFSLLFVVTLLQNYQSHIIRNNVTIRAPKQVSNLKIELNHFNDTIADLWMMKMEKKYLEENERIKSICKKMKYQQKGLPLKWFDHLWTDTRHKIVGCLNAKVGSSTWKSHFYNLLPKEERTKLEKKFGPPYYRYSIMRLYGY